MKVTFLGHACLSVEIASKTLLFDPFISGNPKASTVDIEGLKPDYILVTHAHQDHILDVEAIAKNSGATIISNYEIATHYANTGLEDTIALNQGGETTLGGCKVKFVNAIHSSSFPDGGYGGNPGGFVVTSAEGNFYVSGDTALTYDMKLIGESVTLSWAALCIGNTFTMGYEDALIASNFIGCDKIIGLHYDTFPPIEINKDRAQSAFTSAGKQLSLPSIGESLEF